MRNDVKLLLYQFFTTKPRLDVEGNVTLLRRLVVKIAN